MIWLIIGLIVAVAIIVCICLDSWNDLGEKIGYSIITLLASFLISVLVLFFASMFISCGAEIEYNKVSDTKIIALKDNQNVNGSFYIMAGYVNKDLYYYYTTETEFGYKTEKIRADNAYIKYTDGETHIERYEGEFANEGTNLWAFPMCSDRYIIYCPDGTVTNEFDVDLE